uniref:Probable F-box protein At1g60180 n=1 Tax=Nicotiana sylvestris TaxID=4096 RepID=A0A1U7Y6D9_NICSY
RDAILAWKSLKSVKLEFFLLSEDHCVNLLSGCPALETLELSLVAGFSRLEINSLKLKRLNLKGYWMANNRSDHSLEIIAPYLQHLEISGDLYDLKCRLEDSCRDYPQLLRTLVQDNLQKVLCMFQFKGVLIPETECKHLALELHTKKFNLYGVAGFLRASPYVETLNIGMDAAD